MSIYFCFIHVLLLICAAASAESEQVLVDDKLLEGGSSPGRRTGTLYCRVGIGFHLQIHPDGRINGSHAPDHLSVLELFAVSQGIVGIRGVFSKRYLAMNKRGRLHAIEKFTEDCKFRERFQENSYNTYASATHRNRRSGREWFVALNKRGKAKMGSSTRVKSQHVSTHFLPRFNLQEKSEQGFTITENSKEKTKAPAVLPVPLSPAVRINSGPKRLGTVKYWPKFRFG
ncbi:fibroblast growth factor 5 isoform X1 [Brienomyrus brachyistius]|uniref:fibroblast growth factor 5 isoform X1 n=1 Tax=Brienomyrus brachyistius TaxID=42636 RepID=UPI0020B3F2AC|nr:fibroblast growth factor 5 isoform X1 [Brienomyrus brachyistius]